MQAAPGRVPDTFSRAFTPHGYKNTDQAPMGIAQFITMLDVNLMQAICLILGSGNDHDFFESFVWMAH